MQPNAFEKKLRTAIIRFAEKFNSGNIDDILYELKKSYVDDDGNGEC